MRIRNIIIPAATILLAASCVDDETQDVSVYGALATSHVSGESDYTFTLDNGKSMTTDSYVNPNIVGDDDRVYLTYIINDKPVDGYDYNVTLQTIDTVLTLPATIYPAAIPDSIGSDALGINDGYLSDRYLNINVAMPGQYSGHSLYLVKSAATPDDDGELLDVELRHKLDGDSYGYWSMLVCFDITRFKEAYPGRKGLRVKFRDHNAGGAEASIEYRYGSATDAAKAGRWSGNAD